MDSNRLKKKKKKKILAWSLSWSLPTEYLGYSGPLAMLIPGSVAISLTIYNKEKVRDLFRRSSLKNCLLGFIIPLVAVMLSNCLLWPTVGYTFTLEKVKDWNIAMILFSLLLIFIFGNIAALGEEIGWRGYLLKNLKSKMPNFYIRAVVVGLIWLMWHVPLGMAQAPLAGDFTFSIFCVSILPFCAVSIFFTWLFEKDNSVWPVTIAHATNNFMAGTVPFLFTTMSFPIPNSTAMISQIFVAIGYFIVAVGVIWFDKTRGRRLSDS